MPSKPIGTQAEFTTDGNLEFIKSSCPHCGAMNEVESERDENMGRAFDWSERCDHVQSIKKYNHRWYFYYKGN